MPTLSTHAVDVYPYRVSSGRAEWLLAHRAPGRAYAGTWRMIGGKIREGEAAWETARRELAEETGFRPGEGLLALWALPSVNAHYQPGSDRVVLAPAFAAHVEGEPTLDAEHDAAVWLSAEAAADRLVWPEQARLLQLAARLATHPRPPEWDVSLADNPGSVF